MLTVAVSGRPIWPFTQLMRRICTVSTDSSVPSSTGVMVMRAAFVPAGMVIWLPSGA